MTKVMRVTNVIESVLTVTETPKLFGWQAHDHSELLIDYL